MQKIPQGTAMNQMKAMDDAMENMDMIAMRATVTDMDGGMIAMNGMKMTGDMTV
jgi:hypothetical protein